MVPDLTFLAVPGREEALGMVPDIALESALPAARIQHSGYYCIQTGYQ